MIIGRAAQAKLNGVSSAVFNRTCLGLRKLGVNASTQTIINPAGARQTLRLEKLPILSAGLGEIVQKLDAGLGKLTGRWDSCLDRHPNLRLAGNLALGLVGPIGFVSIPEKTPQMQIYQGVASSPGFGIAQAVVIPPLDISRIKGRKINDVPDEIEHEVSTMRTASNKVMAAAGTNINFESYQAIIKNAMVNAEKLIRDDLLDTKLALEAALGPAISYLLKSPNDKMRVTGEWLGQIYKDILIERYVGRQLRPSEIETEIEEFTRAFEQAMASFNQDSDQPYIENFPQLRILLEASIRKESIDTKMALDKIFSPAFEVESQTEDPETRRTIEWLKSFRKALIKERYGLLENILEDLAREEAEFVLISDDLTPIQVQDLPLNVQGFATEKGGKTSHSTICARSRGVPAVTNLPHDLVKNIPPDALVIIDGFRGRVIVDPDQETLKKYRRSKETYDLFMKELANLDRNRPAVTQDGIPIALRANVEASHEVETALKAGANEGIGLFRTEFAFISDQNGKKRSSSPTEEEQFSIYREAVKANSSSDQPIIMRTIDFEDDKKPDYLPLPISTTLLRAPRGVYLCLAYLETNPPGGREQYKVFYDLFREQVRAILRTSHFGKIKIMFPLVLNTGEFRKARKVVTDIMTELKAKNIPFDEGIQIGTMIENPSAAKDEELARAADFASLGTNDLVQFTTGIGRSDPRSANIDLDPKVIAHIEKTIQNFTENGKSVSLCGNMAAEPLKLLYLLGLGLREISVPASSIEMVKHVIRNINIQDCQELVARIPREASPAEKLRLIREYTREKITDGSWGNLEKVKDWLLGD